jgi:hypothetical protein
MYRVRHFPRHGFLLPAECRDKFPNRPKALFGPFRLVHILNVFDDLAAVDLPDIRNFSVLKRANVHRIYGVGVVLRIISGGVSG